MGTLAICFIIFHQGHPKRASMLVDLYMGMKFVYFNGIRIGEYRSRSSEYSDVIALTVLIDAFCGRPYYAQYFFAWRQVILLDGTQGFGRSGITRQDN